MPAYNHPLDDLGYITTTFERITVAPGEQFTVHCSVFNSKNDIVFSNPALAFLAYSSVTGEHLFTVSAMDAEAVLIRGKTSFDLVFEFTEEHREKMDSHEIELQLQFSCVETESLAERSYALTGLAGKITLLKERYAPQFGGWSGPDDYFVDRSAQYADDGTVLRKNVKAYFGYFVQGYSTLHLNVGVDVDQVPWQLGDLTLKSAKLKFGNNDEVDVPIEAGSQETFLYRLEYTIGEYSTAGDIPFTLTVEDSMGYKSTLESSVKILPYALPAISAFSVARYVPSKDEAGETVYVAAIEGENVWIDATIQTASVAGKNAWTAIVDQSSTSSSMAAMIASGKDGSLFRAKEDRSLFTGTVSNTIGHTFVLTVSDWITENFGITVQRVVYIPNADFVYTYNRYGWAVGMKTKATEADRRFEVGENHGAYFHGGIKKLGADWQELTPLTGSTPATYGGGKLRARRVENKCIIAGSMLVKPSGSTIALAELPTGFVPETNVFSLNACSGSRVARIAAYSNEDINTMDTRGKLALNWVWDMEDSKKYTSEVWVQCSIEYWVEPEDAQANTTAELGSAILGQMVLGGE